MFLCGLLDPWLATETESLKLGRMNGIMIEFKDIQKEDLSDKQGPSVLALRKLHNTGTIAVLIILWSTYKTEVVIKVCHKW